MVPSRHVASLSVDGEENIALPAYGFHCRNLFTLITVLKRGQPPVSIFSDFVEEGESYSHRDTVCQNSNPELTRTNDSRRRPNRP